MAKRGLSEEEMEQRLAERRRLARAQMQVEMHEAFKKQATEAENAANVITQSANQGGNIHNNINVAINYLVQDSVHTTEGFNRRRRVKKGGKKRTGDKLTEKDLMNSSLSKMLDQELLMAASNQQPVGAKHNRNFNAESDSLTHEIFHGDKLYLKNGAMAFKPLGMETVLEAAEDPNGTTNVAWHVPRPSNKRTIEQNIALQQRLDDATAQELVSFPKSLSNEVNSDYGFA